MSANNARWKKLDDLFHQVSELPPDERQPFLDRACADDAALKRELEGLLAADVLPDGWIDGSASQTAIELISSDQQFPRGALIGRYRVLDTLGHGGMGVVYLAERSDGHYDQRVALKVIKQGMDTAALLTRFRRERQILANLDHPGIARLLDGGATPEGRPYLVMEHIEGEPIDQYVGKHRLAIDQRLDLFLEVCEAVQFAHRNLIIHRDLKPSNILVTKDGAPKLLDFGTAKLLESSEEGQTAYDMRLLTPGYASPEQLDGRPMTTASDVFGLGVLLFELLTERHPFREAGVDRQAMAYAVTERPAPRPSTVAPRNRQTRLRGDLDAITLCALRKEPEDRYDSVAALIEDIERHRTTKPVRARQGDRRYRAQRFLKRHRLVLGATLVTLTMAGLWLAALVREQRETRQEKVRLTAMTEFMQSLFDGFDPLRGEEQPVTAREMLDRGADRLAGELGEAPELETEVAKVLGEIYTNLGFPEKAHEILLSALALERERLGNRPRQRADLLNRVDAAEISFNDLESARRRLEGNLVELESAGLGDSLEADSGRLRLGALLRTSGEYDAAMALLQPALDGLRTHPEEAAERIDIALVELGLTLGHLQRPEAARDLIQEAVDRRSARHGDDHPKTIVALEALGAQLFDLEQLDQVEEITGRVLVARRKIFGDDHPSVLASYFNRGALFATLGNYQEAAEHLAEALDRMRNHHDKEHPQIVPALLWSARVGFDRGDLETARTHGREALVRARPGFPEGHPIIVDTLTLLARIERDAGRPAEARKLLEEARTTAPNNHERRLVNLYLAELSLDEDRLEEAEEWLERISQTPGRGDLRLRTRADIARGSIDLRRGELEQAEVHRQQALSRAVKSLSVADQLLLEIYQAAIDLAANRPQLAEERSRKALHRAHETVGPRATRTGQCELALGLALQAQGRASEARSHLEKAEALLPAPRDRPPQGSPTARQALANLS
ncbi:MAG: tetratricopeptide repeat protein [Acidobacteriota bacterium]